MATHEKGIPDNPFGCCFPKYPWYFGAIGDSVEDDTWAVQTAIDVAFEGCGPLGKIVVVDREYRLSSLAPELGKEE